MSPLIEEPSRDPFEANSSAATAIRAICAAGGSDAIRHLISRADDAIASLLEIIREKDAKISELELEMKDELSRSRMIESHQLHAIGYRDKKIAELEGMLEKACLSMHEDFWDMEREYSESLRKWWQERKAGK